MFFLHLNLAPYSSPFKANGPLFRVQSAKKSPQEFIADMHGSRIIQELPVSGQPVELQLLSRKLFCDKSEYSARIFTERYEGIPANGRRTFRAENLLRKIVFFTSCLAAEKVAHAAHIPVSHDALLAIVHRTEMNPEVLPFPRFG
ncbi:transposase family protein [Cytobacillus sp. NJ13]|nr:transposase family protein [Cytobacillus sp. NJ13]